MTAAGEQAGEQAGERAGMPGEERPWLVVVDPQVIFADPASGWSAPRWPQIVAPIRRLMAGFGERVVVTRYVPPTEKTGSWGPYFERWAFADVPADDPTYAIVPEIAELNPPHMVTEPTFGKWGDQLRALVGPTPHLVLAGVATDCCVISTALPAADAGARVTVVSDACAASGVAGHERALVLMNGFDPQIVVRSTDEVLADLPR